jgi:type IV pilus assembly protein PilE
MTLIELVVVMTVVAVLAAMAISSYRKSVMRANRSEAWTALLQIQAGQEKFFMQSSTYTTDLTDPPPTGLGVSLKTGGYTPNSNYVITIATTACPTGNGNCAYTATATAAGGQVKDLAACLTYTINSQGVKTPDETTGCWH